MFEKNGLACDFGCNLKGDILTKIAVEVSPLSAFRRNFAKIAIEVSPLI